ncbi:Disease resistance protein [Acorus calamus]|uniref:Disease resistance protein n=1 Tax=Acorus calamus TaxID=4465 RepID=A0AAV9DUF0_ACOCL|nr:Disease resistance protein [Acorus calamus]
MWPCIMDIAKGAGKMLWEPIKLHVSYFICCERYVNDLDFHVKKLDQKKKVREKMDNEIGSEPSEELLDWLEKVKKVNDDAKRMADKVGEHQHCFTWFSDMGLRHSVGKEAVEKKALIDELLQEKLDFISQPMSTQVIQSLFNEDFKVYQSTDLALQTVMDALQNDGGVHKIGLYGMGGVGKTTLAREIKRRALEQKMFKKAIMVTISQNPNLDTIREKMAEQLEFNVKKYSVSSEKLFSLIKQVGEVLIILDDMWRRLDLSEIGIPSDHSPDRCKIILTSRNVEVCKSMRSKEIIRLGVLSSEDSWKMFKYYSEVVESSTDSGNVCCVARKVADECKGLPLAIATVGRALIETSLPEWEDALVQLKASVPDNISDLKDVFVQLKLSYDYLSTEAQSCLLLCSLFPEDDEISVELLTWYAMGEGFLQRVNTLQESKNRVLFLVSKLKASCLLLKEGEEEETVKMHDVVRDVAIYIGSNYEGCPSKSCQNEPNGDRWENAKECKRLSVMNNNICILPEKPPECSYLQTLLLQWNSELINIPDKFFEKMTSLRVLDLRRTSISSLPASMSYLTNLQVLHLDSCWNLEDISALRSQNKLQVLSLRSTKVKVLSEVIGKFTGLKYLDLRNIEKLRIPPKVISNLCQLEELHVGDSFTKWEVGGEETGENAPLHEIQSLIKLKELSIEVDKYWEDMLDKVLINLERFAIVGGPINTYSWTSEKRVSLRVNLSNLGLPGWVSALLRKTEQLELVDSSCPQLDATGGGGLQCMKTLKLEKCNEMEFIVIDQNRSSIPCTVLPRLKELQLKNMEKLTGICSSPLPNGSLEELKFLEVDDCSKLNIHQILQQSTSLKKLNISRQDSMREVFNTCSASRALLPRLRSMFLADLPELMSIWKGDSVPPLGSLSNLTFLYVTRCNELRYALSLSLAQTLESLEKLHVNDCKMMEGLIPYDVVVVEEASSAATSFSKSISPSSRIFCNLRELGIQHCSGVFLFPLRLAQNLVHLERLGIAFCNRMEVIVRGEEGEAEKGEDTMSERTLFPRLQEVQLVELPKLTSFCSVVGAGEAFAPDLLLPSLSTVGVHDCPRLTRLPLRSQSSPNLKGEKEWLEGLVWDDEKSKTRMKLELVDSSCPQLDATGGGGLQCMKYLTLTKCDEMEFIVIDQNRSSIPYTILPRLKELQLLNMDKLTGVCSSPLPNGSLEELELLNVYHCSKLNINQILQQSTSLESLRISRHDSMKEIISTCSASRALLPRLRHMDLSDLPELMSIWKGDSVPPLGSLSNLTYLSVSGCDKLRYALSLSLAQTLESLERLYVHDCKTMEGLIPYDVVVVEEASSSATSFRKSISPFSRIFCNLRHLDIQHCLGVFLFPLRLAQNLVHLEGLCIAFCNRMEVIVRGEEGEAEKGEDIVSAEGILFPRLREVKLGELPNLTSFCSVVGAGEAFAPVQLLPSLLKVHVHDCPRLTKLPLGSQSSPNLEMIKGEKEWLEGLVWDDEKSKTRFIPCFEVYEVEKEEEDDGEDDEI